MARPSPVPPAVRLSTSVACSKGSKTRSTSWRARPAPVSLTSKPTKSPPPASAGSGGVSARWTFTRIVPPSLYFTALARSLRRIWRERAKSASTSSSSGTETASSSSAFSATAAEIVSAASETRSEGRKRTTSRFGSSFSILAKSIMSLISDSSPRPASRERETQSICSSVRGPRSSASSSESWLRITFRGVLSSWLTSARTRDFVPSSERTKRFACSTVRTRLRGVTNHT